MRDFLFWMVIAVSVAGFVLAVAAFMANTRYPNSDLMGASIVFDQHWCLSLAVASIGLTFTTALVWWQGVGLFVIGYLLILPLKWCVLNPISEMIKVRRYPESRDAHPVHQLPKHR